MNQLSVVGQKGIFSHSCLPRKCVWLGVLWVVAALFLAQAAGAADEPRIPDIVARVNGKDIDAKYIRFELGRVLARAKGPVSPADQEKIIRGIIDKEVVRELVYQEGRTKNIEVPSEVIDREIASIREPYASDEEFEATLKERDITLDELRHSITIDAMARQLLDEQVKGRVHISDEDVQKYYDENKEQFYRPEAYRVRHIFIAFFPPERVKSTQRKELMARKDEFIEAARLKMDNVLKEVNAGGDFAALAKKYSDDAGSRDKGGDLDFIYMGVFDPAFDEAVAKLGINQVSGLVKTEYGFHVIKLLEKRPPEYAEFKEMEAVIQAHLFNEKAQDKVQDYLDALRNKAKIETFF